MTTNSAPSAVRLNQRVSDGADIRTVSELVNGSSVETQCVFPAICWSPEAEGNSTSTALSGGATFTGTWELNQYQFLAAFCRADVAGTLYFEFSHDGVTVQSTFPVAGFSVSANTYEAHAAVKMYRYFRARYVNGTAAQSSLFLYVQFSTVPITLSSPMNQAIGLDADAQITRSTIPQDEIRLGLRTGVTGWNKFGYRTGLTATGGEESIWATTGDFTILTAASTFTVTYDSGTDGEGTTGATQLYFYYIDANGLPAITAHTLGNDGSDETAFTGLGINRCVVSANGGATYNTNAITVTATTGGSTQSVIPATQSVTQQAIFFNGSNHTAIVKQLFLSVQEANKTATVLVKGYVYNRQFATRYEIFRTTIDTSTALDVTFTDPIGFNLNPTDVLYFVADSSADNVNINCRFSMNQYQAT